MKVPFHSLFRLKSTKREVDILNSSLTAHIQYSQQLSLKILETHLFHPSTSQWPPPQPTLTESPQYLTWTVTSVPYLVPLKVWSQHRSHNKVSLETYPGPCCYHVQPSPKISNNLQRNSSNSLHDYTKPFTPLPPTAWSNFLTRCLPRLPSSKVL